MVIIQKQNEIAISEKLTGNDLKVGDTVTFKGHHHNYKISGIMNESMYSHSSMILMNKEAFKSLNKQVSTFYPVDKINKDNKESLKQIKGIKVVNEKALTDNIASYQAEQMPLNLMIISLFVITKNCFKCVLLCDDDSKIPQIGILKAIGIKTKHLLTALLLQIILTTMVGVILAFSVILILNAFMPVTMPFYLSYSQVLLMIVVFLIVGLIGALLSFIKVLKSRSYRSNWRYGIMALQLKHITKTFGNGDAQTEVLKNINFSVNQGEFIILSGASGSGKSTLLNILGGLLSPSSGDVLYKGENLFSKEVDKTSLRLNDIGFIFQSSHLVPYLTVREQLMIVAKEAGIKRKEAKDKAQRLLNEIGLSHRLDVYPHLLSGGEKQRVAIMRAFMNEPKIILADEPTASLDADRATSVVQMIKAHVQTKNMIGIMITHDKRLFEYADRVIEIQDGKIEL